MSAPIRPEHTMRAAMWLIAIPPGSPSLEAVARLIADTEAAAVERVAAERALMDPRAREPIMAAQVMEQAAEIARLKAERDEEQSAHNAIGSVLAQAGCETPDGTSLGFARSAAANLAALSADYADAVGALRWTLDHHKAALAAKPHVATHSISNSERVLSTPRARAVLEQGETPDV